MKIVELSPQGAEAHLACLSALLLDSVSGGASVSFMADITAADADAFWRETLADMAKGSTMVLTALDGSEVAGAVILQPCLKPNQPHRADVAKLLVHSRARRQGLASALMSAVEARAAQMGRTLLTLDTEAGSGAEPLYVRLGYTKAGEIPDYSLTPDGRLCATAIFYKHLAPGAGGLP
jgi:ribosomal protein S18 acetylase RimI-like enzyme